MSASVCCTRLAYTRYQERAATLQGDLTGTFAERYGGDLRRLGDAAERDPGREHILLKGVGDVGVDIFFREAQIASGEFAPFADPRVLDASRRLGLGSDRAVPPRLVDERDFARLGASLDGWFRVLGDVVGECAGGSAGLVVVSRCPASEFLAGLLCRS